MAKKKWKREESEEKATPAQEMNNKPNNKRKRNNQVFPFGNYRNYYGYRVGRDVEEDPRLRIFKKEWFEGKDCLDIGCNSGVVTVDIAKKYNCGSILGIDIDSDRIEEAYWYLRKVVKMESGEKKHRTDSSVKAAAKVNSSGQGDTFSSNEGTNGISKDCPPPMKRDLSDIVYFQRENFVQSRPHPDKSFDTILCLSVTKWIHLNWGDDGLITLFSRIWRLLRSGGIFILEPQPWKSYENNRQVSETAKLNYRNILFRPERFQEILLDKIGFRMVEDITSGLSGTKMGFDRPIFAFHK
ncbi:hypothetical protein SLEP1_g18524 [Rubroshorea leprosula]|uniref:RNA methyltransferase n=1 Tax=Rubroshorea leprosula TaxID=152421 RepID=A0AAV5J6V3_9ROSI|nr:hypothetical protein SLEP1_g18524 [Rubroshorea leprosula]